MMSNENLKMPSWSKVRSRWRLRDPVSAEAKGVSLGAWIVGAGDRDGVEESGRVNPDGSGVKVLNGVGV